MAEPRSENGEVGAVYLTRAEIAARVKQLGVEIARDYAELDPVLVAPLKSSIVFLADLTRALRIPHTLDVVELAPYAGDVTEQSVCSRTSTHRSRTAMCSSSRTSSTRA